MISKIKKILLTVSCLLFLPNCSYSDVSANFDCDMDNIEDLQDINESMDLYSSNKQYDKLLKLYNVCIKNNPDSETIYYNRANVFFYLKEYEKALLDYNKAIEVKPDYMFALYGKAMVYVAQNKFDEALKISDKMLKIKPVYAGAYYVKGFIFEQQEDYDNAIKNYKICLNFLQITPKWQMELFLFSKSDVYFKIGKAYYNKDNLEKALYYFKQALSYYEKEKNTKNIQQVKLYIDKILN